MDDVETCIARQCKLRNFKKTGRRTWQKKISNGTLCIYAFRQRYAKRYIIEVMSAFDQFFPSPKDRLRIEDFSIISKFSAWGSSKPEWARVEFLNQDVQIELQTREALIEKLFLSEIDPKIEIISSIDALRKAARLEFSESEIIIGITVRKFLEG